MRSFLSAQCEQLRQSSPPDVARQCNAQRVLIPLGRRACSGFGVLDGQYDAAGILQKGAPGPGEAGTTRRAQEQGHSQVGLQFADRAGQG